MDTHGDLIKALITHYKKAIKDLPQPLADEMNDRYALDDYLYDRKVYLGICYCTRKIFKINIYSSPFSLTYSHNHSKLADFPIFKERSDIPLLLNKRLNRLKRLLPIWRDIPLPASFFILE